MRRRRVGILLLGGRWVVAGVGINGGFEIGGCVGQDGGVDGGDLCGWLLVLLRLGGTVLRCRSSMALCLLLLLLAAIDFDNLVFLHFYLPISQAAHKAQEL